jgi:hypothetical protein
MNFVHSDRYMTSDAWDVVETSHRSQVMIPRHPTTCELTGDSCLCPPGQYRARNPLPPHPVESVEELFLVGR